MMIIYGGVCAYIRTEKCNYRRMDELNCCENHEILWLYLRPDRLPRGFSCIIAGLVYHRPSGDASSICDHLFNSLTMAESKYPNCGILVTGDFNRLNINHLLNHFRLKAEMGRYLSLFDWSQLFAPLDSSEEK